MGYYFMLQSEIIFICLGDGIPQRDLSPVYRADAIINKSSRSLAIEEQPVFIT